VIALVLSALVLEACGDRRPPPLSAIVDTPFFRAGSSWTYRVQDSSQPAPINLTLTFDKEDLYKSAPVLSFTAGAETLYYDRNLNFVAVIAGGRVLREASPSYRSFDFPFYVGKEWRSVFTFQDYVRTLSWTPVDVVWRVKEYDLVKVPAGEFHAFRLVSAPSTNWGLEEQVWYAPDVRQQVKWRHERTSAHYLGKGQQTGELVQYSVK